MESVGWAWKIPKEAIEADGRKEEAGKEVQSCRRMESKSVVTCIGAAAYVEPTIDGAIEHALEEEQMARESLERHIEEGLEHYMAYKVDKATP